MVAGRAALSMTGASEMSGGVRSTLVNPCSCMCLPCFVVVVVVVVGLGHVTDHINLTLPCSMLPTSTSSAFGHLSSGPIMRVIVMTKLVSASLEAHIEQLIGPGTVSYEWRQSRPMSLPG